MKGRLSLLLAGVLAAGAVLTGCGGEKEVSSQSSQVFAMDTVMLLTVYGDQAQQGLDQAEQTIQKLEKLWSATDETSEIWALNHSGGNWVELSEDTREILSRGLELCASLPERTGCPKRQSWSSWWEPSTTPRWSWMSRPARHA